MPLFGQKKCAPEEIEVSAEMIAAGVQVFVRYDPSGDLATETVAEIYRAMTERKHQGPSKNLL